MGFWSWITHWSVSNEVEYEQLQASGSNDKAFTVGKMGGYFEGKWEAR